MVDTKYYYKVVQKAPPIETIIDTKNCINRDRVERNNELLKFFEFVYRYSDEYEYPIWNILSDNLPNFIKSLKYFVKDKLYFNKVKILRKERKESAFSWPSDNVYFIDFILEKVRICVQDELKIELPSRFESSYFFETYEDCKKYFDGYSHLNLEIIKVEFIEDILIEKFDNNLISGFPIYFTAKDYLNHVKIFLYGAASEAPHFEIVFQGKYKIVSHEL